MIFFDYLTKATEKLPKWLKNKPIWYNFSLLIGDLLNGINIYKDQLDKALNLSLPEPNKRCLEAFLNDLYDPVGRNIQVFGFFDTNNNPALEKAYVQVYIPPTQLNNPNLPNDLQYISKLVEKLLPLPLNNNSDISVTTAYALCFEKNGQTYAIALNNNYAFTFLKILRK